MSYPFELKVEYAAPSKDAHVVEAYQDMFDGRACTIADHMEFWWERLLYRPPVLCITNDSGPGFFRSRKVNGYYHGNEVAIHIGISEAPEYVIDALIVHEIAHYRWKRHTRAFWSYVYNTLEKSCDYIDGRFLDGRTAHDDCIDWMVENGWMRIRKSGESVIISRSVEELDWYKQFQHTL